MDLVMCSAVVVYIPCFRLLPRYRSACVGTVLHNYGNSFLESQTACFLAVMSFSTGVLRSWRNGFFLPVLKHGPRSLTNVRVCGWQTCTRNESNSMDFLFCTYDRLQSSESGLSISISVRTRKMVNYAWVGWSQGKLWWRLVAVLTCKSIVKLGYRGERLIEPSSSWFPPKFPSG